MDNCGLVYLKTNTQETADAISKRLGKKTIEASSISQSLSFKDFSGNSSTSLIARELLTPDEVKQLHYKMIIFPTTGYPVFRNTILYSKFKCYKAGKIERKVNNLLDLSDNYFTVEDIDFTMAKNEVKFQKNRLPRTERNLLDSKLEYEKSLFQDIKEYASDLFKNTIDKIEYKECNNRVYMSIKMKTPAENRNLFLLKSNILSSKYHIEINNDNTCINVHLKSAI